MTEQPRKCVSCGSMIPQLGDITPTDDLCSKCEGNPKRQEFYAQIKEQFYGVPIEYLEDLKNLAVDPESENRFLNDVHRTAKKDDIIIQDTFHTGLSTYFDPFNLCHKAKSGAGKTYVTLEVFEYFPDEDVVIIGTQSPKVISHDYGELMTVDESGKELPFNYEDAPIQPRRRDYDSTEALKDAYDVYKIQQKAWEQRVKKSFHLIKLTGKAYVFLDTISRETFEMFKCVLSHDKGVYNGKTNRIVHKFVDDKGKVHVAVLEGCPSSVFCTVDKDFIEEFATRTFTDTPEDDTGKIQAAQEVTDNKTSYPWEYDVATKEKILMKALIRIIKDVTKKYSLKTVKPFPNLRNLLKFSNEAVRDMRDYEHFNQMLPTYTAFKLFQRPIITINGCKYVVVSIIDVLAAKVLFDKIAETTRTSTEKSILDFYHKCVEQHKEGAILKEILADHPEYKSERTARYYLVRLETIGYVNIRENEQADKRLLTYYALKEGEDKLQTSVNFEDTEKLKLDLQKDFETWFKTITTQGHSIQLEKLRFDNQVIETVELAEFKQLIGIKECPDVIVSNQEKQPNKEKKSETTAKQESNLIGDINEKHFCSQECSNFRQAACPSNNYGYRPVSAEIPLDCPGYSYKGDLSGVGS